ncbi:MAG TPA: cytidine deaminase [Planctomycetota bacterium]|nr:cytidine deaminase [Planctomycetota bacterium]MDP6381285.1 cytidine deaminase [Phycisphaerae bacterium]MDP7246247.1 cytidine deaminase [Planctomycetota bacterium]HJM38655.1 cytidine deaminase [Planctomycetota bacterium]
MTDTDALLDAAARVAKHSYSPYSQFRVGAAILDSKGEVHVGTNVENSSYGLTICAERSAIFGMVAEGNVSPPAAVVAVAVWVDAPEPVSPCGACRQVLSEFGTPETEVILGCSAGGRRDISLGELLPDPFSGSTL